MSMTRSEYEVFAKANKLFELERACGVYNIEEFMKKHALYGCNWKRHAWKVLLREEGDYLVDCECNTISVWEVEASRPNSPCEVAPLPMNSISIPQFSASDNSDSQEECLEHAMGTNTSETT